MDMKIEFVSDFIQKHNTDFFRGIPLPQFHTDYPLSLERICILYIRQIPAAEKCIYHAHSYYELHFLLSGEMAYQSESDIVRIASGTWLLIPCHYIHKVLHYHPDSLFCTFQFGIPNGDSPYTHFFKEIFHRSSFLTGTIGQQQIPTLKQILEMSDDTPLTMLTLQNTALNTVIDLSKQLSLNMDASHDNQSSWDVRYLMALQYINDNICRKISVEDVSRNVYLSPRQLNRIFQKKIGKSILQYISQKKSDKSKELLQISDSPLHDIATELGFHDEYYFNRFFKKCWGISPHQYRLQYRREFSSVQEKESDG